MKKLKMVCFAMPFTAIVGFGQLSIWDPAGGGVLPPDSGDWMTASNWTGSVLPTGKAVFNVDGAADCLLTNVTALAAQLSLGDGTPAGLGNLLRIGDGGELTIEKWCAVGYNASGRMVVEPGGRVNIGTHLWISFLNNKGPGPYSAAFVNDGGEVNIGGAFGIQFKYDPYMGANTYRGHARLTGGITRCKRYILGNPDQGFDHGDIKLDIAGGLFIIEGDWTARTQEYIAAGLITGYGGPGTVHYVVTPTSPTSEITTVWAEWDGALAPPNGLPVDYFLDDCKPEKIIGRGGRGDLWVANAFTVQDGGEVIVSIEASFDATKEWPLEVHLYDDPNDDGIPDDLALLQTVQTTFPARGACHKFPIPPTEVTGVFFVALSFTDYSIWGTTSPLLLDITSDQRQTWYVETSAPGTLDPSRLPSPVLRQSSVPGYGGQYLIRATGVSKPVPMVDMRSYQQTAQFGLTWGSTPGASYEILRATDLGLGVWTSLDDARVPADALTCQLTMSVDGDAAFYRVRRTTPPVIFGEAFEFGASGWAVSKANVRHPTKWELGELDWGPYSAHSGTHAYGTNLSGDYANDAYTSLRSPLIDLSGVLNARLSFWYIGDFGDRDGNDHGKVEILDSNEMLLLEKRISGASTWFWNQQEIVLPGSAYGNSVYLRFTLADYNDTFVGRGLYLDDVYIRAAE